MRGAAVVYPEHPMETTPEDTARHLARRAADRRRAGLARIRAMEALLPEIARVLREDFAAVEVRAFGSVVRGDGGPDCDLDVAVRGLSAVEAAQARGRLSALVPFEVDLVRMETAPASLLERIESEEGRAL